MRIKDGSISIFELEMEIEKLTNGRFKYNDIFVKLNPRHQIYSILSKYDYGIGFIRKTDGSCFTVEGFAGSFDFPQLLDRLPFNLIRH